MLAGVLAPDEGELDALRPRRRLGAAAAGAVLASCRWPRTCACSRGWRSSRDPEAAVAGCSSRPISPTAPTRRSAGSRAATGSASTSRSGCSPSRRCCCSTSRRRRWTRASASGCGSSSAASPAAARPSCSRPTTSPRSSATPTACWCSPTASCCSPGPPRELERRSAATATTSRPRSSRFLHGAGHSPTCAGCSSRTSRSCGARRCWSGLLIVYPIAIALMIGFALSSPPGKPTVAFYNEVPPGQGRINFGSQTINVAELRQGPAPVDRPDPGPLRADGDRQGARRRGAGRGDRSRRPARSDPEPDHPGRRQPDGPADLNTNDPLERQFVHQAITTRINQVAGRRLQAGPARGGQRPAAGPQRRHHHILGRHVHLLGLRNARTIMQGTIASLPARSTLRAALKQVVGVRRPGDPGPRLRQPGARLDRLAADRRADPAGRRARRRPTPTRPRSR